MAYCNFCPGYCCYRTTGSFLLITAEDINRLARYFGVRDGEIRKQYMENKYTLKVKANGACIFQASDLKLRRCTVHLARPFQCRQFPYGKACPYLMRSDLYEQIQPRVEAELWNRKQTAMGSE